MTDTNLNERVPVTQGDTDLAYLCVPGALIFADAAEHIADARRRAAEHIARHRIASEQSQAARIAVLEGAVREARKWVEANTAQVRGLSLQAAAPGEAMLSQIDAALSHPARSDVPEPAPSSSPVIQATDAEGAWMIVLREWFGGERYARDYEYLDHNYRQNAERVIAALTNAKKGEGA